MRSDIGRPHYGVEERAPERTWDSLDRCKVSDMVRVRDAIEILQPVSQADIAFVLAEEDYSDVQLCTLRGTVSAALLGLSELGIVEWTGKRDGPSKIWIIKS
jgi:hypothetical protein